MDKIFRRTKFSTPSWNFDNFVRFLPDFCTEILDKIFDGQNVRHQFEISTILSNEFLSDKVLVVEEMGWFWDTAPCSLAPCSLRGMSGQVLRVKGYYDVMIHKHHCEDVYDLIDLSLWYFAIFYKHFWGLWVLWRNDSQKMILKLLVVRKS